MTLIGREVFVMRYSDFWRRAVVEEYVSGFDGAIGAYRVRYHDGSTELLPGNVLYPIKESANG